MLLAPRSGAASGSDPPFQRCEAQQPPKTGYEQVRWKAGEKFGRQHSLGIARGTLRSLELPQRGAQELASLFSIGSETRSAALSSHFRR